MFNKSKTKENSPELQTVEPVSKPKILCLDLHSSVIEKLKESKYFIYDGSLGFKMKVPKLNLGEYYHVELNYKFPENLHEYDFHIIDLTNPQSTSFKTRNLDESNTSQTIIRSLILKYPAQLFDPRPLSASILRGQYSDIKNKKIVQIVFAAKQYEASYKSIQISSQGKSETEEQKFKLYSFNSTIPISNHRIGEEVIQFKIQEDIFKLIEKNLKNIKYEQTFAHPELMNLEKGIYESDPNFIPVLKNTNDEIISYIRKTENIHTYVFPNIEEKGSFLIELFSKIFPAIYPNSFPFSTLFKWLEHSEYLLPGMTEILKEKESLELNYKKNLEIIENKYYENERRYHFLHEILTETGDKLVHSLYVFFKWLEFEKVIIKDHDESKILEEDIQIEIPNGLLIIEIKGIGGTSTDSDCSQINKIKHRRCKERGKFDVWALYIVNHQRYLPPQNRINPPFTQNQITDAENEERGLLTTWQLFNLYTEINNGNLTKSDAMSQLLKYGLIKFRPNIGALIGIPKEILKNSTVIIIDLKNCLLKVNDIIYIEKNDHFIKAKILSIMLNDKSVNIVENGETGIKLDVKISKNSKIYKSA